MIGWIFLVGVVLFILSFLVFLILPDGWSEVIAILLVWLASSLLTIAVLFSLTWIVFWCFGLLKYGIKYVWGVTFIFFILNAIFHKGGSKS